jgi:hypothetical protein
VAILGKDGHSFQQICHLDRSEPGFPATHPSPTATNAAFVKESRMKLSEATNFNRKSGGTRISCHAALTNGLGDESAFLGLAHKAFSSLQLSIA